MSDMPRPRLPYVQREVTRHSKVTWYFRMTRGGKRVRLPDDYGSAEFKAAYQAALKGAEAPKTRAAPHTLAWLVERYKDSAKWSALAPSTQKMRDNLMRGICERGGTAHVKALTKVHIQQGMDARAKTPEAANAFLKTMRSLLAYAVKLDVVEANVAEAVDMIRSAGEGHRMWSLEEVARYERRHPVGTKARLALDLMLYTGLRRSDVVRVGHAHIRDGVLTIRPEKTRRTSGVIVTIRVMPALAATLAATKMTGRETLLVTDYGKPFTAAGFGNWFRDRCDEAGVTASAHGLRKVSATRIAENGGTTHELMAMFGWTTAKEAERYTAAADRARMGVSASAKLTREREERG